MKPVYIPICSAIVMHPNQWIEKELKKAFTRIRLLDWSIYGATLARAQIFRLGLLQISVISFSSVKLVSNLTPNSFSHSPFLTSYSSTPILEFSLELTNRWYSSTVLFKSLWMTFLRCYYTIDIPSNNIKSAVICIASNIFIV